MRLLKHKEINSLPVDRNIMLLLKKFNYTNLIKFDGIGISISYKVICCNHPIHPWIILCWWNIFSLIIRISCSNLRFVLFLIFVIPCTKPLIWILWLDIFLIKQTLHLHSAYHCAIFRVFLTLWIATPPTVLLARSEAVQ